MCTPEANVQCAVVFKDNQLNNERNYHTFFSFFFFSNCAMLVLDLGSIKVSSDPTQERITNTKVTIHGSFF